MRKSLQPPQGQMPAAKRRHSRWRTIIVLAACLSLVATSWITAQQAQRQVTRKIEQRTRPARVAAPVSLTPTTPVKEYIYAGGKLVATEEPASFSDVPVGHAFYDFINKLAAREVTTGCGSGAYCPEASVTREQMAAFIIRTLGDYNPPAPASQRFLDVPSSNPFYAFIEQMAVRQITLGCGGGNYCPTSEVTREQMSAFIIRALHEPGYVPPPPPSQRFLDVPPSNPFYAHIEEMAVRQITLGCGGGYYCPTQFVTRAQMAAFLVRAFGL